MSMGMLWLLVVTLWLCCVPLTGWLIKLKDVSADELNDLMSVEDYKEYLETAV